jgi:hypothetical protein
MAATDTVSGSGVSVGEIVSLVAVFALVGVGIGLSGAIAISQLGGDGALVAGLLLIVVLTIAFLLWPVIGLIGGLRAGQRHGRLRDTYLSTTIGSAAGFLVMMGLVLVLMMLGLALAGSGGGGAGGTAAQSGSGASVQPGQLFVPIVITTIPTVIVSLGGTYFGGGSTTESAPSKTPTATESTTRSSSGLPSLPEPPSLQSSPTVPTRYVAAVVLAVVVIVAVTVGPSLLFSPTERLNVEGEVSGGGNLLFGSAIVTNPSDTEVTTDMTLVLSVNGEEAGRTIDEVSIPANGGKEVSWELQSTFDLSDSQTAAIENGNFQLQLSIDGETVETVSTIQ